MTSAERVKRAHTGKLILIPNSLGGAAETVATGQIIRTVLPLCHFIVEELRSARRYLRSIGYTSAFEDVSLAVLNEHSNDADVGDLLQPLFDGHDVALLSEAGCPCIADPGAAVVRLAHTHGIRVSPMGVPSSILLTLMASGLNGQQFTFNGYLPRDPSERIRKIKHLEQQALGTGFTQLFMDAPYRNNQVMGDLLTSCKPTTMLCLGNELTTANEWVITREIELWREKIPDLHKRPVMFALGK